MGTELRFSVNISVYYSFSVAVMLPIAFVIYISAKIQSERSMPHIDNVLLQKTHHVICRWDTKRGMSHCCPNIYGIRVRVIPKVRVRVRVIPKVRVRVGVIREVLMPGTSGMVLYIWYGFKHLVWLN